MAGQLVFTLEEFKSAAIKWRKELLMLPIIGCQDTLQHMTGRPGIRYKEKACANESRVQACLSSAECSHAKAIANVGAISGDAQFGHLLCSNQQFLEK